jgi:hypothetical protein
MEYPPGFEPLEATARPSSASHWSVAATSVRDSQSAMGTTSLSQRGQAREKRPRDSLPGPVDGKKARTAYKCVRPDSWSGHTSGSRQFRTAAPAAVHRDAQQGGCEHGNSSNFLEPGGQVALNGPAVARFDDLQRGEQERDRGGGGSSKGDRSGMLLGSGSGSGLSLDSLRQPSAIQPISGSGVGGGSESRGSLRVPVRGMEAFVIGIRGTIIQSMMQRSGAKMRVNRNGEMSITGTIAGVEHARVLLAERMEVGRRKESRGLGRE